MQVSDNVGDVRPIDDGPRPSPRDIALRSALRRKADRAPAYSVAEAAALLGVSQDLMYRLVKADAFPAIRLSDGKSQGRFVVPAAAIERLLKSATDIGGCVDVHDWTANWRRELRGAVES